jgi:hypothetical protein
MAAFRQPTPGVDESTLHVRVSTLEVWKRCSFLEWVSSAACSTSIFIYMYQLKGLFGLVSMIPLVGGCPERECIVGSYYVFMYV